MHYYYILMLKMMGVNFVVSKKYFPVNYSEDAYLFLLLPFTTVLLLSGVVQYHCCYLFVPVVVFKEMVSVLLLTTSGTTVLTGNLCFQPGRNAASCYWSNEDEDEDKILY